MKNAGHMDNTRMIIHETYMIMHETYIIMHEKHGRATRVTINMSASEHLSVSNNMHIF